MTPTPRPKTKPGEEIRPGDVIMFLGRDPHLVDHIKVPSAPTLALGACGIAKAADGWGITLFPGHPVEVA